MIRRPDLVDADGAEVSHWLIEHGVPAVFTTVVNGEMLIDSSSNSDEEIEAALEGFVPVAKAGEYEYVPPRLRSHKEHLRAYSDAEADGSMATWTAAEFRQRTAHALADLIEYVWRERG